MGELDLNGLPLSPPIRLSGHQGKGEQKEWKGTRVGRWIAERRFLNMTNLLHSWVHCSCCPLHKTCTRLGPSTFHQGRGGANGPHISQENIDSYWVAGVVTDIFSCNFPPMCMQLTLIRLSESYTWNNTQNYNVWGKLGRIWVSVEKKRRWDRFNGEWKWLKFIVYMCRNVKE